MAWKTQAKRQFFDYTFTKTLFFWKHLKKIHSNYCILTPRGGRNDILFVNLHRCLKNLRKFDKQHIKSSLVFVLVDGGCLAAIFL